MFLNQIPKLVYIWNMKLYICNCKSNISCVNNDLLKDVSNDESSYRFYS